MVLEWISVLSRAGDSFRRDDNAVDRLHNQVTVSILVIFAVVSTTHQLVGNPITCWAPKEFESSWIKYTNSLCWVKNTYWLPFEEEIPKDGTTVNEIIYYQWIPFIFLGMAIFFYFPSIIWTSFNSKAGVDSDNILESAEQFRKTEKIESKDKLLRLITNQIHRFVGSPKTLGGMIVKKKSCFTRFCCLCGKKFGNYLVLLYISCKFLYIVNVVVQLFFLNGVLQTEFGLYGISALTNAFQEREFLNHTIFPKVTMCNVKVRALGVDNTRRYTVQCLLPINLYTEKMFVAMWFWMALILLVTTADFVSWILRSVLRRDRYAFIENSLIVSDKVDKTNKEDKKEVTKFVHDYLRSDGVFVLRLIASNTNKISSSEIIASLWDNWIEKKPGTLPKHLDTDDSDDELNNVDTMPLKPLPPTKPKPPSYRPNVGPPPPPIPTKPSYPKLDEVDGLPGYNPSSPPPSAPPANYNQYS